jgi:hypothetical protein
VVLCGWHGGVFQRCRHQSGESELQGLLGNPQDRFGPLPTLIGKSVFDTDKMGVGSVIMMKEYVKADFRSGTPARAK